METKKAPALVLSRYRFLFGNLGLVFSLILTIAAFEWRFYEKSTQIRIDPTNASLEVLETVPVTINNPPKPVIKQPVIIETIDEEEIDDIEISYEIEYNELDALEEVLYAEVPEEKTEQVLFRAEVQPEPVGGLNAFLKYVGSNIKYPKPARMLGIQGVVYLSFIVDKDGSLTDVSVVRGIGGGCDEEALRVIKEAPKWKPGKQRGRPVKVRMAFPVHFRLR